MKKFNTDILPVIAMSPGNGYFTENRIKQLIQYSINICNYAVIVTPNIPAIATYRALGYPENKARRKAIDQGNNLLNKARRAIETLHIPDEHIYVIDWQNDVTHNQIYIPSYQKIKNLFNTNKDFNIAIKSTTRSVLEYSKKDILDMNRAVSIAIDYILCEFAFLEVFSQIFGCNQALFMYHRDWPVYEQYIAGDFDSIKRDHMGFEKIKFN